MPERRVRMAKRAACRGFMFVSMLRQVARAVAGSRIRLEGEGGSWARPRRAAWAGAGGLRGVRVRFYVAPGRAGRGGKPDQVRGGGRLLGQLAQELLLAADAAYVRGWSAPVADVGQSLEAVQLPGSGGDGDASSLYADPYRLIDLEGDTAHGVHDLLHAAEVHDHVAVDGDTGKVLDRLDGKVGAAGGGGGAGRALPHPRHARGAR